VHSLDIDWFLSSSVKVPMHSPYPSLRLLIYDGPDFAYQSFIELITAPFFGFPVDRRPGNFKPITKLSDRNTMALCLQLGLDS
jgi:hypothetical protein